MLPLRVNSAILNLLLAVAGFFCYFFMLTANDAGKRRGVSSDGRAAGSQSAGHRFDPGTLHQEKSGGVAALAAAPFFDLHYAPLDIVKPYAKMIEAGLRLSS